jgi:ABC-type multidrug transport system permease subunit
MNRIFHWQQLFRLTTANFKELIREPGVLFWGIIFPILMSLGLGIAFTKKSDIVREIAIIRNETAVNAVTDTGSVIERKILRYAERTEGSHKRPTFFKLTLPDEELGNTIFQFSIMEWHQALVLLKRGNLNVVLEEKEGAIVYHFDPMNPDAQLTFLKLSKLIGGSAIEHPERMEHIEPLTLSGTRYIDFLVPGLIAMGVMMSCMWGLSYGIIEKRSKKLLRRMVATPMKKSHFLISMITVRVAMNFLESALLFLFVWLVFGITIQGSIAALIAIFIAGNITFAGIAIFISSHTANTEIGNGLINAVVMPMMVLSGIFFSYHNFPDWSIPFIRQLPLTLLADSIRGIFIEGAGFAEVMVPLLILAATGVVFFTTGLRIFKWH